MACGICKEELVDPSRAYRLSDDRLGQRTHLGDVVNSLLEEDLCTNSVCHHCRSTLLRLNSLKQQFDELKRQLLTKFSHRGSQSLVHSHSQPGMVTPTTSVRLRSPSAVSTGISPLAKRTRCSGVSEVYPNSVRLLVSESFTIESFLSIAAANC